MLKEYAVSNGLSENIIFLGYSSNVNDILQNMHVGIMASKCEAFGRVTVEYMNASMPVIAADTGGSIEIVQNNISGYIYKQGDYIAMANIIAHIIENPECISTLGSNGYDIAHKYFTLEQNADGIYSIITNIHKQIK